MRLSPLALALVAALARPSAAQSPGVADHLRTHFGLRSDEIAQLDGGRIVTRRLTGVSGDEVAFIGVARIAKAPLDAASRTFAADLPAVSPSLIRRAGFSRPPSLADLASYALPDADIDALRGCAVGACVLKLPADAIAALGALDWKAPDVAARASEEMRAWLLEYVRGYLARGNDALVIYEDGRAPLLLHDGFHTLLAAMPTWADDAPQFHHYLDTYPRQPLPGVRDTIVLYLEDFGLRPLTSVVHSSSYAAPERSASPVRALIARKQIFATHYFRARLSLLAFVTAPDGGAYLLWLDRSLFDTKLNRVTRGRVEGRLEDDLRDRLTRLRTTLQPPAR